MLVIVRQVTLFTPSWQVTFYIVGSNILQYIGSLNILIVHGE